MLCTLTAGGAAGAKFRLVRPSFLWPKTSPFSQPTFAMMRAATVAMLTWSTAAAHVECDTSKARQPGGADAVCAPLFCHHRTSHSTTRRVLRVHCPVPPSYAGDLPPPPPPPSQSAWNVAKKCSQPAAPRADPTRIQRRLLPCPALRTKCVLAPTMAQMLTLCSAATHRC